MLKQGQDIAEVDYLLVADVLLARDRYIAAAERLTRATLGASVQPSGPEFTFYVGSEWVLRFTDGGREPIGIFVIFNDRDAVRLEDLESGDLLE
ncbi:hypothetical protein [Cryptosporangium japonicum]|uniref:Uncharacterized protein n=1 Tax=Cryptosporangium japonicum TaxID=80872 RepID=A0ABN0TJM5_9ACTN